MQIGNQIKEYLSHLKVERQLSSNTLIAYEKDLKIYSSFLELKQVNAIQNINEESTYDFQQSISTGQYSRTSIQRMLASVRGLHKFALREKWVTIDATTGFVTQKLPSKLPKALSVEQTIRLVDALKTSDENPVYYVQRAS
ncbi:MAG: site-specific integrase [Actinobacteria bacterium]|nr:site-specific integrase [Actinomycetota bacterium]